MEKYLTLRDAVIIATLKGPEYRVKKHFSVFMSDPWVRGEFQFSVEKIVKRDIGKGHPPRRALPRALGSMYGRRPRLKTMKQWHIEATKVVANMSSGELRLSSYADVERRITHALKTNKAIEFIPESDTILTWLKTNKRVDDSIKYFRDLKRRKT
jgi:hypothetical protein